MVFYGMIFLGAGVEEIQLVFLGVGISSLYFFKMVKFDGILKLLFR